MIKAAAVTGGSWWGKRAVGGYEQQRLQNSIRDAFTRNGRRARGGGGAGEGGRGGASRRVRGFKGARAGGEGGRSHLPRGAYLLSTSSLARAK